MDDSILNSVKKMLGGISEECEDFDNEIIIHINTVLAILTDMGFGPKDGFMIADSSATWSEFIPNIIRFNMVKTYVGLKVKMIFDPPESSYLKESIEHNLEEIEVRLNNIVNYEFREEDEEDDELGE